MSAVNNDKQRDGETSLVDFSHATSIKTHIGYMSGNAEWVFLTSNGTRKHGFRENCEDEWQVTTSELPAGEFERILCQLQQLNVQFWDSWYEQVGGDRFFYWEFSISNGDDAIISCEGTDFYPCELQDVCELLGFTIRADRF